MASRSTNTMQEALQKMMRDIADMKTLPDADIPWLVTVENMVIERLKQPAQMAMEMAGIGGMSPDPMSMGAPAGAPMGGGFMAGAVAPAAGELNRMLNVGGPGL